MTRRYVTLPTRFPTPARPRVDRRRRPAWVRRARAGGDTSGRLFLSFRARPSARGANMRADGRGHSEGARGTAQRHRAMCEGCSGRATWYCAQDEVRVDAVSRRARARREEAREGETRDVRRVTSYGCRGKVHVDKMYHTGV